MGQWRSKQTLNEPEIEDYEEDQYVKLEEGEELVTVYTLRGKELNYVKSKKNQLTQKWIDSATPLYKLYWAIIWLNRGRVPEKIKNLVVSFIPIAEILIAEKPYLKKAVKESTARGEAARIERLTRLKNNEILELLATSTDLPLNISSFHLVKLFQRSLGGNKRIL